MASHANSRFAVMGFILTATLSGCSESSSTQTPEAPRTARAVLEKMAATYKSASTYADSGDVQLTFKRGDEQVDEKADFSVTFERPDKLRMHCYQGVVVVDRKQLRAYIDDLPNQVLWADVPAKLTLDHLHADEILRSVLTEGIAGSAPQLDLLLGDDPIGSVLTGAKEPRLGGEMETEGRDCYRVEVPRDDGTLVLAIDKQSFVLRQIEYPVEQLRKQLASEGDVANLALVARFRGARINDKIDPVAFQFESTLGAKLVERFDTRPLIPKPQAPSSLLGTPVGEFSFAALDGGGATRETLAGKVVVIECWGSACGQCVKTFPNLERVYQKYRDNDRVAFLAVHVALAGETNLSDSDLRETFQRAGVTIPILRDPEQHTRNTFTVNEIPNLFVLGPDGTVEHNEVGFNPNLAEELPLKIDRLLAGESIHADLRRDYENRKAEYDRVMAAPEPTAADSTAVPRAQIAQRSEPATLKLTRLWTCNELKQPGNILVVSGAESGERWFVNDGWRRVVELSPDGKIAAQHDLPLPEPAVISFLRTTVDSSGRRFFAGTASAQKQLFVFDEQWHHVLAYPKGEEAEIADLRWGDLDGDGTAELLVGFWGVLGAQCVSHSGERIWSNRSIENVVSIAVGGADVSGKRKLLCANQRGTLVAVDHEGKHGADISVGGRFVRLVVAEDLDTDGQPELSAIGAVAAGRDTLVGIDADGTERWSYELPEGLHEQPIEMITSGRLLHGSVAQWLVAAADGSIHVINADGTLVDRWNHGSALTGLAVGHVDGAPVVLISSVSCIDAWEVDTAAAP